MNYINQGGTGFVAYQPSKPLSSTGVYINNYLSPAHAILIDNKPSYITYFALPMNASKTTTRIMVFARDEAGNETNMAVPCVIKEKKFRSDKMNLSENFLQQKMPEFQAMFPQLQGKTPLEIFTYVNTQMRNDNFSTIQKICQKSANKELWEGTFLRMKDGAPMALFGDKRSYVYNGKVVGESIHTGVDLASNARSPIEATNKGIIVFTGALGIYGNTVIIDHGLGMSAFMDISRLLILLSGKTWPKAKKLDFPECQASREEIICILASSLADNLLTLKEWWDPHWIKDNINK